MQFTTDTLSRFRLGYAAIGLLGLGFAVWVWIAGGWADDFPYRRIAEGYDTFFSCQGPAISSAGELPAAWAAHYLHVNGRLANMMAIAVLQLPLWLSALMQGVMYALYLCTMSRLIGGKEGTLKPLVPIGVAVVSWMLLPWEECSASQVYLINYLWSSTLNLLVLRALLDRKQGVGVCVLAIVAAPMHEAMGVALSAMIVTGLLCNREWRSLPGWWHLPVCYIAATAVPLLSPALSSVAAHSHANELPHNMLSYHILVKLWPLWVALPAGAVVCLRCRRRKVWSLWAMIAIGMAATIAIALWSHTQGRAYWWALVLAIMGVGRILYRSVKLAALARHLLAAALFILLAWWMTQLCLVQARCSADRDFILAQMRRGKQLIVRRIESCHTVPWYLLDVPGCVGAAGPTQICNLAAEVYGDYRCMPAILPDSAALRSLRTIPSGALAGSNGTRAYYASYTPLPAEMIEATYLTDGTGPAVNPLYNLRYGGAIREVHIVQGCYPTAITAADTGFPLPADTLWLYRPTGPARSLYGHHILSAKPYHD